MTIRETLATKAEMSETREFIKGRGQLEFVYNVMKWENCSYDEAVDYCFGRTDPVKTEYTLGYKLADPVWSIGIYKQPGHHARARAAANFRKQLTPEEDELFVRECLGKTSRQIRKEFKSEIRAKKKEEKAKGHETDLSELEGEDDEE